MYKTSEKIDGTLYSKMLINSVLPLQLVALALPFGQVKNVLLLKSKKLNEATQVSVTWNFKT